MFITCARGFQWYIDLVYRLLVARDRVDRHYRHMASGASGVVFRREDRRERQWVNEGGMRKGAKVQIQMRIKYERSLLTSLH